MNNLLLYNKPGRSFNDATPMGNGKMGAMIFGGVVNDQIQLNEDSVYWGGPMDRNNPDALESVPKIRQLLADGEIGKAQNLARAAITGTPKYTGAYLPLCDFKMLFLNQYDVVAGYKRELDISKSVTTVTYEMAGVSYKREYFVTADHNCMLIKLSADKPGMISVDGHLIRRPYDEGTCFTKDGSLLMEYDCGKNGVHVAVIADVAAVGGSVRQLGDYIRIEDADSAVFMIAADTTWRENDPAVSCQNRIVNLKKADYKDVLKTHITEYQGWYNRYSFKLWDDKKTNMDDVSTDQRILSVAAGNTDLGLESMYMNFNRYLLISCSRPNSLAANLQGIWNDSFKPPWESIFTININTEMNYWPACSVNLEECALPYFEQIKRMVTQGRKTAREMYDCGGWMAPVSFPSLQSKESSKPPLAFIPVTLPFFHTLGRAGKRFI